MQKVWDVPELVTNLLALLDPLSVFQLVESGVIDKESLKKSLSLEAWNILKMMKLKEPNLYLQPLLCLICKMRAVKDPSHGGIEMICSSHPGQNHWVRTGGFILLEEAEAAFGTRLQSIKSIKVEVLGRRDQHLALRPALSSRISRQLEVVNSIDVQNIEIRNNSDALAFSTLMQAQKVSFDNLAISGAMGEAGWLTLARALKGKHPEGRHWFEFSKQGLLGEARSDDFKDIWDAVEGGFGVVNAEEELYYRVGYGRGKALCVAKSKYDWEQAWTRLKRIWALTKEEFTDELQEQNPGDFGNYYGEDEGDEEEDIWDNYGEDESEGEEEGEGGW